MFEIKREGVIGQANRKPTEFTGSEAEKNAMTTMIPGDIFYVGDDATKKLLAIYMYSGAFWWNVEL